MIINKEHRQNLLNIAKKLKYAWYSIPTDENNEPTETYLEYLSLMYNPEIAELIQVLDLFPKTLSLIKFAKKVNMDKNELMEKLDDVSQNGFVVKFGRQYALPFPLFVYDGPFLIAKTYRSKDALKFAQLGTKFFYEEGYYKKWQNTKDGTPRNRILTVSEKIEPGQEIIPAEEVYNIIEQTNDFAVVPCPCRNRTEIAGVRECKDKYPIHNCLLLGPYAKASLEFGDPIIKAITKEEAKELVREASELGLVHNTDNKAKNCTIICSCCECCCGHLTGMIKYGNPRAIGKANYIAYVNENLCVGCGTCIDRCKFSAIVVNDIAEINTDKCMGCGLCAVTCPNDALTMRRLEREEVPLDREEIEIVD